MLSLLLRKCPFFIFDRGRHLPRPGWAVGQDYREVHNKMIVERQSLVCPMSRELRRSCWQWPVLRLFQHHWVFLHKLWKGQHYHAGETAVVVPAVLCHRLLRENRSED